MKQTLRAWTSLAVALVLAVVFCLPALADTTLASAKTPLNGSSKNKVSNIELAVAAIDGTTLAVGDYFSFNETVGPRTSSYGYKNALNGRGVKVTGGGVAQVASTLYLALKKVDGITYEEKQTYSHFTDDYVSNKKNAIVVDYKAGTDFSFYNDGGYDFRIDMWVSDDYVHCSLVASGFSSSAQGGWGGGYSEIYLSGGAALKDNVNLAVESIYDTTLSHGDLFSFNDIVGPRTERYGYQKAVNGRGVKVVGGGVAQVASAIYMAVKDLDCVEIVDKTTYNNYNQDYVASASDAIAVDYSDDIDFSFRYTGYGTLSIYTQVSRDVLSCEVVEY